MNKFRVTFQTKSKNIYGKRWSYPTTVAFYDSFAECYEKIKELNSMKIYNYLSQEDYIKFKIWVQGKDCWEGIYEKEKEN